MVILKELVGKPLSGEWGTEGEGIQVLRTTNFQNNGVINFKNVVVRNVETKKIEQKRLIKGDIIIEKSGGSPTQPVGRVVFFDYEGDYICNNFTSVLRPNKVKVVPKYLHYILFANHKFGVTEMFQNKTTGIINLQLTRYLEKVQIPLPPLETQKRIAQILDDAAALRDKTEQLLKEYDALAQSIFLDMFGDPVKNEKNWKEDKVLNYTNCIVPGRDKPKSFTGNIPWITTDDLNHLGKTHISKKKMGLSEKEILEVRAKKIPVGSVIMTCVGNLGVISINDIEMIINQQLHAFQCMDTLNNLYLMYNLNYQKKYMYKMASTTTVPYMNKSVCNSIPILIPPIKLQNQFAEKIALIEKQKELAKQELQESQDLFNCLLQKAFKGELV